MPGLFLARCLRHPLWWASALPLSLLVLLHSVFWLGIFHVPITRWTVAPCLLAAAATAALLQRRFALPGKNEPSPPWTGWERALLFSTAAVGAVLLARSAISPLIGFDTAFRWDFLAQRIFRLGRFDFYPPLTPADFRTYFYPDAIPPMISFAHWWLYASAGRYLPSLISIFVAAQFACTLAFTYGTARALYSRRAAMLAAAILAGSPLYFRAVVIGQETGLTALAIAAMLYFIVTARQPDDTRAMISAGLAAALCALAREYGWIALVIGAIAIAWRRQPWRQILVFGGVAAAIAGPWYARTWILTGNPFYSLRFAGLPVNPVHAAFLDYYHSAQSIGQWTSAAWLSALGILLAGAALPVLAGIPAACAQFRRHGYLLAAALVITAVWLQSAGYTSGGVEISMRVLSPAMVALAVAAASLLDRWPFPAAATLLLLFQLWTAAHGVLYPHDPGGTPLDQWADNAFLKLNPPVEFQARDRLASLLPPGSRILSDDANLHAALIDNGIQVVPVWSPEVRFIFSAPPEEAERRLRALGIGSVALSTQGLNTRFLVSASPLYHALPQRWRPLASLLDVLYILVPGNS